jgi:major intracellular serine protease
MDFSQFNFINKLKSIYYKIIPPKIQIYPSSYHVLSDYYDSLNAQIKDSWKYTKGQGVKVAILDTGVDYNHPDLRNAIVKEIDITPDRDPMDHFGHGTHVAGIIGARGKMTGVAPECEIYSIKVLNDEGTGNDEWLYQGILAAIDLKVNIINMSLGSKVYNPRVESAIKKAYDQGIILVASAGNDGYVGNGIDTMGYPAKFDEVISVGAVDYDGNRASFSSVGKELDICTIGTNITSTYPNNQYVKLSGTSMACPFITGISALIYSSHNILHLSKHDIHNTQEMLDHLKRHCIDLGPKGVDEQYGNGAISLADPDTLFKD